MAHKKKLPSTFFNMFVVLTVISTAAALALGYTYTVTKEAREQVKIKRAMDAIKDVLPEFNNNPNEEKYILDGFAEMEFFPAKKDSQQVGTAVRTYSEKGFGGRIWLMVGFDKDNRLYKIKVLEHKETPGLGNKMEKPRFIDRFAGKDLSVFKLKVKKDGGDVDAITAATISSRAFCDAVERAYRALSRSPKGGKP
jgi:electron transport complex protein RnfG